MKTTQQMATWNWSDCVAELAAKTGEDLRLSYDAEAPMPWAVWCVVDEDGTEDIVGAGDTPAVAVDEASDQIRAWL